MVFSASSNCSFTILKSTTFSFLLFLPASNLCVRSFTVDSRTESFCASDTSLCNSFPFLDSRFDTCNL
ncbi:hypothetical protein Hanom_Chr09g00787301 [Helianthus anomalus]